MPRLAVAVPKYRKHSSRNQAFIELDGQRIYLGRWQSPESIALYRHYLAQHLLSDAVPPAEPPETESVGLTVAELADRYGEHAGVYYRKNGQPTREAELVVEALAVVVESFGNTLAEAFGAQRLIAVRDAMIAREWSRGYVNRQVSRIKRAFKHALAREWIERTTKVSALPDVESLAKGRTVAHDNEPVEGVPDGIVDATLPHLPRVVADMVRFQRLTGCRPGELVVMMCNASTTC
jgi:hypothetical protein